MYEKIYERTAKGGQLPFSICHNPGEVMPFSVQYGGGGHYFKTASEAVSYCCSRKWITEKRAIRIMNELSCISSKS